MTTVVVSLEMVTPGGTDPVIVMVKFSVPSPAISSSMMVPLKHTSVSPALMMTEVGTDEEV